MTRRAAAVACLLGICLAATAAPAGAHGFNFVSADPQVSDDGTDVVEALHAQERGWLALYREGRAVGHVALERPDRTRLDVPVRVEETAWRDWPGNVTLRAVLHGDDGDGRFEPEADPKLAAFGRVAADSFAVERGDPALATARGDASQRVDGPAVTVRRATLPADGHLVVHDSTDGTVGRHVGNVSLSAGTHRNVTVDLAPAYHEARNRSYAVWAVLYRDDGDGRFDGGDDPLRAGGQRVATRFGVRKAGVGIVTPSGTTDGGAGADSPAAGDGAGPGAAAALAALVAVGAWLAGRRR